jgi:hypothetical protein
LTTGDWFGVCVLATYFLGVGTTDVLLLRKMGRRMQQQHPEAWKKLGVRSVHTLAFSGYFRQKEHLKLNDPELNSLVTLKKRFDNVTGIVFVVVAISVGTWLRRHG